MTTQETKLESFVSVERKFSCGCESGNPIYLTRKGFQWFKNWKKAKKKGDLEEASKWSFLHFFLANPDELHTRKICSECWRQWRNWA